MSNNKKTLFFAINTETSISKTLEKSIILENCEIEIVNPIEKENKFNLINIKVVPDDTAVLSLDSEDLETLLDEQAQEMKTALLKKYPNAIELDGEQVRKIKDNHEQKIEEKLTINLNPEEKIARAGLVKFVKEHGITGVEASYLKNIFREISSLRLITEDDPIGNQKKSIRSLFPDREDLVDLVIHLIDDIQTKLALQKVKEDIDTLDSLKDVFVFTEKATWPKIGSKEKTVLELAAEEVALSQKNPRGRPKKHKF